ncbi:MAG TPA: hypothetical protein VH619_08885 [Verrucomicrobiae bacterium]|nr:hypothetical protein [Verrucomicrobiae bacterium]
MKILNYSQQLKITIIGAGLACAGCNSPVTVSGGYQRPGLAVGGTVATTTNSVTVGGNYTTGTTNVDATITVGK